MNKISWERKRFKKNKVWLAVDENGKPLKKNGKALVKYQLEQEYEYWVNESSVKPLNSSPDDSEAADDDSTKEQKEPSRQDSIVVYTDGASSGNPGPSGIGVFLAHKDHEKEISKNIGHATCNIAELEAVRTALLALKKFNVPVKILTDSAYVCGTLGKEWKAEKNSELIFSIKKMMKKFKDIKFIHIKGHAGIKGNERADRLARNAIEMTGKS